MKSVYIAGPYTSESKRQEDVNIFMAAQVAASYMKQGYAVFCPHTMTSQIDRECNDDKRLDWERYLTMDIYWLSKCDSIHMLRGWRESRGATIEYMVAKGLGLEVLSE